MTNANEIRAAVNAEAARLGWEVARCDLRKGLIHLRRGNEVRGLDAYGRFLRAENAVNDVRSIAARGLRLDRIKGSNYFAA